MEDAVRKALMYDFYGPLLTPRQQDIYEMYYGQDMSLGEIAEQLEISRQAVWDILKRSAVILEEYEQKLGLIRRHMEQQRLLAQAESMLAELRQKMSNYETAALMPLVEAVEQLIHRIRFDA